MSLLPGPGPGDAAAGREPADVVAEAVLSCPAVAALADDGLVATFLPGRRVHGVSLRDHVCEVAVVLHWDDAATLPQLAEQVRQVVAQVAGGRRVDVLVADLLTSPAQGVAADRAQ